MTTTNSFDPSETVKFVIQNNSSIKRSIKVFNTSISWGNQLDLMKVPGISEEDIRFALTKGSLKNLIEGGSLVVIESTINLSTSDSLQNQFIRSKVQSGTPGEDNISLSQSNWYIDPVSGSDTNDGKTSSTALKTYSEWQYRVGNFTVLTPAEIFLTINIINDLPISDPVTFRNIISTGHSCFVKGVEKVLATGTLTGAIDKARSTNTPFQISDTVVNLSLYIGKKVVITSGQGAGSSAYILRDMGSNTVHMSEWMSEDVFFDNAAVQSASPTTGSGYKIIDYTQVYIGATQVGYEETGGVYDPALNYSAPMGGLAFTHLHVAYDANVTTSFSNSLFSSETIGGFSHCIIDSFTLAPGAQSNAGAGNVLFRGGIHVLDGCQLYQWGGAYLPEDQAGYPGGIRIERGGTVDLGADVSFVGTSSGPADIQCLGHLSFGVLSFWDSYHTLFPLPGGIIWGQNNDYLGDGSNIDCCLWGTGNGHFPSIFQGSSISLQQFKYNDGYTPTYPSIEWGRNFTGDGYLVILTNEQAGNTDPNTGDSAGALNTGYAFDGATGSFSNPRYITWANMDTNVSSGGFLIREATQFPSYGGQYVERLSRACDPSLAEVFQFIFQAYVP